MGGKSLKRFPSLGKIIKVWEGKVKKIPWPGEKNESEEGKRKKSPGLKKKMKAWEGKEKKSPGPGRKNPLA